jgi:echinoderm microtubule-associated protein-like 1/2
MNCISQVVKFSPNGQLLAIGSRDNNIYMYQVVDDYRRYNRMGRCVVRFNLASFNKRAKHIFFTVRFQGHSSFVTHMDWATDSTYLQTNSGDYELLYCEYSGRTRRVWVIGNNLVFLFDRLQGMRKCVVK